MTIRPLEARDRPPVLAILAASQAFSRAELTAAEEILDLALSGDLYPAFVLEVEGAVLGYICLSQATLTESSWYVYWICVHPDFQGRGAGRALNDYAEQFVRSRGGRRIVLETSGRPDYARTRRFYERAGYRIAGAVPDFYRDGDDLVVFWKPL
jgi:ribosomal protein S18 acetylase RimI-like enzyme